MFRQRVFYCVDTMSFYKYKCFNYSYVLTRTCFGGVYMYFVVWL